VRSATRQVGSATVKLIGLAAILICLALGVVGLVLPIVPGLLFLAIAALIAARHSPSFERLLRTNRRLGGYLDGTKRFQSLSLGRKLQVGALLCLKMLLDAAAWTGAAVGKLAGAMASAGRYGRRRTG
jgi:hypothetical protein